MEALGDFISSALDFINLIISTIGDVLADTVYLLSLLGQVLIKIHSFFSWIPPAVSVILFATYGVLIILRILGRDG